MTRLFLFVFFIIGAGVYSANAANVSIDDASITEASGAFINFDVNIDVVDTSNDTIINYTVSDGTATDPSDYDGGGGSGSVTIPKFGSTAQISIATYDDSIFEGNENFTVILTSVSRGNSISDASATGIIIDDEGAPVINIVNAAQAPEGTTGSIADISLSHAASVDINVDYTFADGTASNGVDFTGVDGTATVTAGLTTVGIPATIITDGIDEATFETFTITASNPSLGSLGSPTTETVNIVDVDGGLSIDDVTVSETAGNANVTVTLQGPTVATVTVDYATADSTATAGADYTAVSSTTLTFAATGNTVTPTTKTFTIPITDDSTFEGNENFTVSLSNVTGAAVLTDANATITITDNESTPTVDFNAATSSGSEGTASATVQLDLSTASSSAVTVSYTATGGTASGSGTDYTLGSGTFTIPAGSTSSTLSFATIVDDSIAESGETIEITLSSPSGATLGSQTAHTFTITDNDTASLSPSTQTVSGTVGSSITATTAYTATSFSGTLSYAVSPALPSGLSLNSSTGVVSGTPSASQSATSYTVTGTGSGSGSATATISITVSAAPALSPSTQSVSGTVGSSITATTAYTATSFSGTLSYAVSPALPSGLSLNSSTGVVSGTPSASQSATSYTITGTGSGSGSATATISITVAAASVPALSPSTQSVSGTAGSSITATTAYTATNFSGTLSYAVSPALPSGLSLDSSTGVVSGTPSASQSATSYTITGTGSGSGSATATISITVSASNAISNEVLTQAQSEVEILWRSNDRLYNDRVTDQSRKILQLSLNDTLSGDCGTKGHALCGATIEIANAARRIGKPDLVVKAGIPEIAVNGDDDGIDAKASFADVKKLLGAGSKRIVSVATEYVDHKGDTSTHSLMASVAREYFDKGKNATFGVMTHIYRAKTDVKGNYSGDATTEGINFGSYTNYFGNKNYVVGFYGSIGFSRTKYDLTSITANVKNDFNAWNAQMGANVMGKRKFESVLYMPKITLDTFLTKQKNSMPLVTAGSAVRHGFIASRVLSEIQLGFRPHFKIANINNTDKKITVENLTQEIDFNPQIFCGYSANSSDCGLGIGITNKWKPKDGDTEYRLGGDFSEYRGERKSRLEFNMETEINGNPNMKTTTTVSNDNIVKTSSDDTNEVGVNWRFDYRF